MPRAGAQTMRARLMRVQLRRAWHVLRSLKSLVFASRAMAPPCRYPRPPSPSPKNAVRTSLWVEHIWMCHLRLSMVSHMALYLWHVTTFRVIFLTLCNGEDPHHYTMQQPLQWQINSQPSPPFYMPLHISSKIGLCKGSDWLHSW